MDAIYFVKEENRARRIDSECVLPMREAGYTIYKMLLDGKNELTQLTPEEEMPKDYLQESRYGMVMILETEGDSKRKSNEQDLQMQIVKQQEEISELRNMIEELKGGAK